MKLRKGILVGVFFTLLLLIVHLLHMTYLRVNVVFYAAILDAIIASVITLLILQIPFFKIFNSFEKGLFFVIALLLGYSFAISVPTVIDRSLSFYILEKIQQRGGGIQQNRFSEVFTQEYLKEHQLVAVRLTEQLESGTIVIENGCVKLTEKGNRLASSSRFYRQNFLPKNRLLLGKYSDDLTNPFKHSESTAPDYICK